MNTKGTAGVVAVLLCAAVGIGYWLGYKQGSRPRREIAPLTTVDVTPNTRVGTSPTVPHDTSDSLTRVQQRKLTIPPRDPTDKAHLIDLSSWYNAGLIGNWHGSAPDNDFSTLPTGIQTLAGTEFDVRGLIQLRASDPGAASYPRQIKGIPLAVRCHKIHFLHNTLFGRLVPIHQLIGSYVVQYADGETLAVPLQIGENIFDWWASPDKLPGEGPAVVAWKGTNGLSAKRGQSIHLSKFTWENPRPEVELRAFDFVGEGKTAGPFLMAVTVEP